MLLPLAETVDVSKLATAVLGALLTGGVGVMLARARRPPGHYLERLWELRGKTPDGEPGEEARRYLDDEVSAVIAVQRDIRYRVALQVLLLVATAGLTYAARGVLGPLAIEFGRGFVAASGLTSTPWLTALAVALLLLELLLVRAVLVALWVVMRRWTLILATWELTDRRLLGAIVALVVLLAYLVLIAIGLAS